MMEVNVDAVVAAVDDLHNEAEESFSLYTSSY